MLAVHKLDTEMSVAIKHRIFQNEMCQRNRNLQIAQETIIIKEDLNSKWSLTRCIVKRMDRMERDTKVMDSFCDTMRRCLS